MVTIYMEGGGDPGLKSVCGRSFGAFLEKAGFKGKMPKIVACGSRNEACDKFSTAVKQGKNAFLLIDSEEIVSDTCQSGKTHKDWEPWNHLGQREGDQHWEKPPQSEDKHCHFMVVTMESWLLADRAALSQFYGNGFKENKLPPEDRKIETLRKDEIYKALKDATKDTTKGEYSKGGHSFKILEKIDPQKVIEKSPWARRFIDCLRTEMGA